MKKVIFIIFFLLFISCEIPSNVDLAGYIFIGTYEGLNWTNDNFYSFNNTLPSDFIGDGTINDVYVDGNTIYLCTGGGLSISKDKGSTWVNYTVKDGLASNDVREIFFDGSIIYLATMGGISKSVDGGQTWLNFKDFPNIGSICADGLNIYAVVLFNRYHPNSLLIKSNDGGETWEILINSSGWLEQVYAKGSTVYLTSTSGLSVSTNNGDTWINYTEGKSASGIFDDGENIYTTSFNKIYYSSNGVDWNVINTAFPSYMNDIFVYNSIFYVTTCDGLYISPNNGSSWVSYTKADGLSGTNLFDIYVTENDIYVCCIGVEQNEGIGLNVSSDGGETWKLYTASDNFNTDPIYTVFATKHTIYAGSEYRFRVSKDGGLSWKNYLFGEDYGYSRIKDINITNNNIYLVTDHSLFVSYNEGYSWKELGYYELWSPNCVYIDNGIIYIGTDKGLDISEDGGKNWVKYDEDNGLSDDKIYDVYVNKSDIFLATLYGLNISRDGGENWTVKTFNGRANEILVIFVYESTIYLGTGRGYSVSKDNGYTWETYLADSTDFIDIFSIYVSGSKIYIGTDRNGLKVSNDSGATWSTYDINDGLNNNTVYKIFVVE